MNAPNLVLEIPSAFQQPVCVINRIPLDPTKSALPQAPQITGSIEQS
jgi:hypothetical protein